MQPWKWIYVEWTNCFSRGEHVRQFILCSPYHPAVGNCSLHWCTWQQSTHKFSTVPMQNVFQRIKMKLLYEVTAFLAETPWNHWRSWRERERERERERDRGRTCECNSVITSHANSKYASRAAVLRNTVASELEQQNTVFTSDEK
jgi:hypothetical protein